MMLQKSKIYYNNPAATRFGCLVIVILLCEGKSDQHSLLCYVYKTNSIIYLGIKGNLRYYIISQLLKINGSCNCQFTTIKLS